MEKKQEKKEQIEKKSIEKKQHKPTDKDVIKDLTDTLQRLQAEFENYKKRIEAEKKEFVKYSKAELILRLLPVLDSFELALKNSQDLEKFKKGVELIYAQLYSVLEQEGVRPIKALGERCDPYKHEVLLKDDSDKEEDVVLEELQKGYMLHDKVLRHSKVKVSKKAEKSDRKEDTAK